MNIKFSHIALALIASTSFSAVAEKKIDQGIPPVIADAEVTVRGVSKLSLGITPVENLTVEDIKKGSTVLAKFKLTGDNVAVRMVNADSKFPYCTISAGNLNAKNKLELCIKYDSKKNESFLADGSTYYIFQAGEYDIRAGGVNNNNIGVDTYKFTMEAVSYTL
ncbi:TPA: hypothetical protein ACSP2Z_003014 [Aeromonas hydrophila]